MNIIIFLISILVFIFSIIFFVSLKAANISVKGRNFIKKVFIKKNQNKPDLKRFRTYLNDYSNFQFLKIKVNTLEKLYFIKVFFSFSIFILINFIGLYQKNNYFILSLFGAIISFLLPTAILKNHINKKTADIYTELPDFIDFLYLFITAGLTFEESVKYFIENMKGNICDLLKIYRIKQMEGNSKNESLEYISNISLCPEFERVLRVISESEIVGNPINNVLKDLSLEIRRNQRDQIKIRAEKLENKLIFIIFIFVFIPMILLFILPVIPQFKLLLK